MFENFAAVSFNLSIFDLHYLYSHVQSLMTFLMDRIYCRTVCDCGALYIVCFILEAYYAQKQNDLGSVWSPILEEKIK